MKAFAAVLGTALLTGCSVVGVRAATEQPKYSVLDRINDDIEIRRYGSRTVAEVEIEARDGREGRSRAFRILAGYIFGTNRSKSKIAMTAPVETQRSGEKIEMTAPVETRRNAGKLRMAFFLPAKYSAETAPIPVDPRVKIRTVPGEIIAALRFSGTPDQADLKARREALMTALSTSMWRAVGEPVSYFYDPPWTPSMMRRNEVAVRVKAR
ncbi:MAG: heme-binding protein [Bauldia litoralis]